MTTYAVPDIHGRFDLLEAALDWIHADSPAGGRVVFLGDYIDRGPQSREVIERLMAGPYVEGWEWVCLKGNHEDMMVEAIRHPMDADGWLINGGTQTLASYAMQSSTGAMSAAHVDWCDKRPLIFDDGKRVFVHAAINPNRSVQDQSELILLWHRFDRNENVTFPGRHVVHGHTPYRDGPVLLPGRTNLDTYAVGTGRLIVAKFLPEVDGGPVLIHEIFAAGKVAA